MLRPNYFSEDKYWDLKGGHLTIVVYNDPQYWLFRQYKMLYFLDIEVENVFNVKTDKKVNTGISRIE